MARVVLARRARAELLQLDWPLFDAVEQALELLAHDPHAGYPLQGRLRGLRSLLPAEEAPVAARTAAVGPTSDGTH